LTDDRQVEPTGEVAEYVGGSRRTRRDEPRFDRNPRPLCGVGKLGDRGIGGLFGERAKDGDSAGS
jgi:hypothetical protein